MSASVRNAPTRSLLGELLLRVAPQAIRSVVAHLWIGGRGASGSASAGERGPGEANAAGRTGVGEGSVGEALREVSLRPGVGEGLGVGAGAPSQLSAGALA